MHEGFENGREETEEKWRVLRGEDGRMNRCVVYAHY